MGEKKKKEFHAEERKTLLNVHRVSVYFSMKTNFLKHGHPEKQSSLYICLVWHTSFVCHIQIE